MEKYLHKMEHELNEAAPYTEVIPEGNHNVFTCMLEDAIVLAGLRERGNWFLLHHTPASSVRPQAKRVASWNPPPSPVDPSTRRERALDHIPTGPYSTSCIRKRGGKGDKGKQQEETPNQKGWK